MKIVVINAQFVILKIKINALNVRKKKEGHNSPQKNANVLMDSTNTPPISLVKNVQPKTANCVILKIFAKNVLSQI